MRDSEPSMPTCNNQMHNLLVSIYFENELERITNQLYRNTYLVLTHT